MTGIGMFQLKFSPRLCNIILSMGMATNTLSAGGKSNAGRLVKGRGNLLTRTSTAYYYITWGIWLRRCLEGHEYEYVLHWPRLFTSVPEVRHVKGAARPVEESHENSMSKPKMQ